MSLLRADAVSLFPHSIIHSLLNNTLSSPARFMASQLKNLRERASQSPKMNSSTVQAFVDLLLGVLDNLVLSKTMCIGNATDGASNMQGQFKGFSD